MYNEFIQPVLPVLNGPLPLGSLIYLSYLCVHTPIAGVTRGYIVEWLVLANQHHTWCWNRGPLGYITRGQVSDTVSPGYPAWIQGSSAQTMGNLWTKSHGSLHGCVEDHESLHTIRRYLGPRQPDNWSQYKAGSAESFHVTFIHWVEDSFSATKCPAPLIDLRGQCWAAMARTPQTPQP